MLKKMVILICISAMIIVCMMGCIYSADFYQDSGLVSTQTNNLSIAAESGISSASKYQPNILSGSSSDSTTTSVSALVSASASVSVSVSVSVSSDIITSNSTISLPLSSISGKGSSTSLSQVSKQAVSSIDGLNPEIIQPDIDPDFKGPYTGKYVFLTFDDGPSSNNTPLVLSTLKKYNVKATFFVCGYDSAERRNLIKQEFEDGNVVGIHCYSHNLRSLYKSEISFFTDFNKIESMIIASTGSKPTVYRFPGGTNNDYVSKSLSDRLIPAIQGKGYVYYDWNVSSGECATPQPTAQQIANNIVNQCIRRQNATTPSIVLMHDSSSRNSRSALPIVIESLLKKGFIFISINQSVKPVHFVKK